LGVDSILIIDVFGLDNGEYHIRPQV